MADYAQILLNSPPKTPNRTNRINTPNITPPCELYALADAPAWIGQQSIVMRCGGWLWMKKVPKNHAQQQFLQEQISQSSMYDDEKKTFLRMPDGHRIVAHTTHRNTLLVSVYGAVKTITDHDGIKGKKMYDMCVDKNTQRSSRTIGTLAVYDFEKGDNESDADHEEPKEERWPLPSVVIQHDEYYVITAMQTASVHGAQKNDTIMRATLMAAITGVGKPQLHIYTVQGPCESMASLTAPSALCIHRQEIDLNHNYSRIQFNPFNPAQVLLSCDGIGNDREIDHCLLVTIILRPFCRPILRTQRIGLPSAHSVIFVNDSRIAATLSSGLTIIQWSNDRNTSDLSESEHLVSADVLVRKQSLMSNYELQTNNIPMELSGLGCMALAQRYLILSYSNGIAWLDRHQATVSAQLRISSAISLNFNSAYDTLLVYTADGMILTIDPNPEVHHKLTVLPVSGDIARNDFNEYEATLTQDNDNLEPITPHNGDHQLSNKKSVVEADTHMKKHQQHISMICRFPFLPNDEIIAHFICSSPMTNFSQFKLAAIDRSGTLSVMFAASKHFIGSCDIGLQDRYSFASSPDGNFVLVAIGIRLLVVDIQSPRPRVVHSLALQSGSIKSIAFNSDGFIFALLTQEQLFFFRSKDFQLIGIVNLSEVFGADDRNGARATYSDLHPGLFETSHFVWVGQSESRVGTERILLCNGNNKLIVISTPSSHFDSMATVMDRHFLLPTETELATSVTAFGSTVGDPNQVLVTLSNGDLLKLVITSDGRAIQRAKIRMPVCFIRSLSFSQNGQLVACASRSSDVYIRSIHSLEVVRMVSAQTVHDEILSVSFSPDSKSLLITTSRSVVASFDMDGIHIEGSIDRPLQMLPIVIDKCELAAMPEISPDAAESLVSAANSIIIPDINIDNRQMQLHDELLSALHAFRSSFEKLNSENESLAVNDRLPLRELAIDLHLQQQIIDDGEKRVEELRFQLMKHIESAQFVASKIRMDCWDCMDTKGMLIKGLKSDLVVHNFPLRKLSLTEMRRLKHIENLRVLEISEQRWHALQIQKSSDDVELHFFPETLVADSSFVIHTGNAAINAASSSGMKVASSFGHADTSTRKSPASSSHSFGSVSRDTNSLRASISTSRGSVNVSADHKQQLSLSVDSGYFGTPESLLYHSIDCVTIVRKRMQIVLLQQRARLLQLSFNEIFQQHFVGKECEVTTILEKTKRIAEIQSELNIDAPIWRPSDGFYEHDTSFLEVKDSEIQSKRFIPDSERHAAEDREAQLRAGSTDDTFVRGLKVMMDGTLESKHEKNLLDFELVREPWMDEPLDKMTEEQKVELARFEKKSKLVQTEQETRRKLLQTELAKLKADVQEIAKAFDGKLRQLADIRTGSCREYFQLESIILSLEIDIVDSDQHMRDHNLILENISEMLEIQNNLAFKFAEVTKFMDTTRRACDTAAQDLKTTERIIRKEFSEIGGNFDALMKICRARLKRSGKRSVHRGLPSSSGAAPSNANYSVESTMKSNTVRISKISRPTAETPEEFSSSSHNNFEPELLEPPTGVSDRLWSVFLDKRRTLLDNEESFKLAQQYLITLEAVVDDLQQLRVNAGQSLHDMLFRVKAHDEHHTQFLVNTLIFIRLVQGLVEISDYAAVHELHDCLLINRSAVEQVNSIIVELGVNKLKYLQDIMVSNTQRRLQLWKQQKLELELHDTIELTTELQLLRATKNLQMLIKLGGHDNQKAVEVQHLDKKLEFLSNNSTNVNQKLSEKFDALQQQILIRRQENARLDGILAELRQSMFEKQQIHSIQNSGERNHKEQQERRMHQLMSYSRMMRLSKLQAKEILMLRHQVETLRKRTIPSLSNQLPQGTNALTAASTPRMLRASSATLHKSSSIDKLPRLRLTRKADVRNAERLSTSSGLCVSESNDNMHVHCNRAVTAPPMAMSSSLPRLK